MSDSTLTTSPRSTKADTFTPTRHRGLSWRETKAGKTFYGYIDGRRRPLEATTERDAVAELGELRGKAAKGEKPADRTVTFAYAFEAWFSGEESPQSTSTRKLYRMAADRHVLRRIGKMRLADIGLDDVIGLVRHLRAQGLSRATTESYLCLVRGTFKWAQRREIVSRNPCALLTGAHLGPRDEQEAHRWTTEQLEALFAASEHFARQPESRYDYTPILRLAASTGLRLGELAGLEWGDVDLTKGLLRVERQYTRFCEMTPPKTRRGVRTVPLGPEALGVLRELRAGSFGRHADDCPVFVTRSGNRVTHRNVTQRGYERAAKHAGLRVETESGVEGPSFHDLRHAFAARVIANMRASGRLDIYYLAEILGHADTKTTERVYGHLLDADATHTDYGRRVAI